jgi:DNA processing protein
MKFTIQKFSTQQFELLSQIHDSPKELYIIGNEQCLQQPCFAIVGTRRPSAYGKKITHEFSRELSNAGFCIVSGLALGIDSFAHLGALSVNKNTIAVLGHGLDTLYPPENRELAIEIIRKGGCLVSEYPESVKPLKHHFPKRNRIISGLSFGTLVVEAKEASGSLITAKYALEQNRDVFTVCSQIQDENYIGCHQLIQQGAKLALNISDILSEYDWLTTKTESEEPPQETPFYKVFEKIFLDKKIMTIEEIFSTCSWTLSELSENIELAKENKILIEIESRNYLFNVAKR